MIDNNVQGDHDLTNYKSDKGKMSTTSERWQSNAERQYMYVLYLLPHNATFWNP